MGLTIKTHVFYVKSEKIEKNTLTCKNVTTLTDVKAILLKLHKHIDKISVISVKNVL